MVVPVAHLARLGPKVSMCSHMGVRDKVILTFARLDPER